MFSFGRIFALVRKSLLHGKAILHYDDGHDAHHAGDGK